MQTIEALLSMNGNNIKGSVSNTTPVVVSVIGEHIPSTVWIYPAGGTSLIEYSVNDAVTFQGWPAGAVTAYAQDVLQSGITHLRITAQSGTCTYGVC